MYLGGIDKVHQLDDVIAALSIIKNEKNIAFEFVGDGKEREKLMKVCETLGVHWVKWTPSVPKKIVPEIISHADVLVLSTSTVMYGSENKLAEYLMAGKPILTYTPATHNDPAISHNCGLSAAYGNINDLAEKIKAFAAMSVDQRAILGKNSRMYAEKNLSINILAEKLDMALLNVRKK
jgi:glycosyltransferase involved in cell wall biosynthesis